ncbi:MAG: 50S ribosomal protein L14e [Candidatus Micrarchaeota archaeon]|nr:50S ribosomal protein L14e [Candidatus Micrarchaeota archaeon]
MPAMEPGRVCIKTAGRDAGARCVVLRREGGNFAIVAQAFRKKKKERKVSMRHLEPLDVKVDISSEENILQVLKG